MSVTKCVPAVLAAVLFVTACGGGGTASPTAPTTTTPPATTGSTSAPTASAPTTPAPTIASVSWQWTGQAWQASGTPPACPNPPLSTPVDLSRVTSILFPGQVRGGNYKPHGGFRFDGSGQTNAATITAAMDASVFRGARYLESGQVQYLFDFINACGYMFRLDHLRELSAKFQAIANGFPAAAEGGSQTTTVSGQTVTAGETIATAVGFTNNVSVDFGVYDLRQRNAASGDPAWLAGHPGELASYAVCWFDLLPSADAARVRSLPASTNDGRVSDYCR